MRAVAVLLAGCTRLGSPGALVPPTVDEDPSLPRLALEVEGVSREVHARVFGDPDQPALLVLHGSLGDHRAFLPFEAIADRYEVVMWDQRGNGLSERVEPAEYTQASIVAEIEAIRQHVSPDAPVTLVGHSFGGMYAALYTSTHPDRVDQLALLEPGGLNGEIFGGTFGDIIEVDLLAEGLSAMMWQSEVLTPDTHAAIDYRALLYLLDSTADYFCDPENPPPIPVWRPGGVVDTLRGDVLGRRGFRFDFDFAAGLDVWPGDVLLVGGSCGGLGAPFQERWHVPLFRDPALVEVPGVGHRLVAEDPEAVLDVLRAFLAAYRE